MSNPMRKPPTNMKYTCISYKQKLNILKYNYGIVPVTTNSSISTSDKLSFAIVQLLFLSLTWVVKNGRIRRILGSVRHMRINAI